MVRPVDLSEFSYGYALTESLVRQVKSPRVAAPRFPSLLAEASVGYDVNIPALALFLQFKLSEQMVNRSARGAEKLGVPHLRMHLRATKRSDQHPALVRLEEAGELVLYATPTFTDMAGLDAAYAADDLVMRSRFFKPSAIPIPDDGDHFVAFSAGTASAWRYSEPVETPILTWEGVALDVSSRSHVSETPSESFFARLSAKIDAAVGRESSLSAANRDGLGAPSTFAGAAARAIAGLESSLLLLQL